MKPYKKPILVTKPIHPNKKSILSTFSEIIDSGWFTNMGSYHNQFEKQLLETLNIKNISVFNNGAIALITALKALELPKESEVITTPFTFAATPHAIAWNNLKPVFADIEENTMTLSPKAIEQAITKHTSAILGVHVYGFPCHVKAIESIAKKHNLRVIYDAAHAFGTTINGHSICSWGDISMLSFHATKLFNSIEGGALVYNNETLSKKIYELRNFGIKKIKKNETTKEGIKDKDFIQNIGINGKLNEFQAAWGLETLSYVKSEQEKRHKIAKEYKNQLQTITNITIPEMPKNTSHSMQYFPVLCTQNTREQLYNILLKHNIYSRKYFYPLCSDFKCYKHQESSTKENLPISHKIANSVLCLPFYGELSQNNCEAIKTICKLIKESG